MTVRAQLAAELVTRASFRAPVSKPETAALGVDPAAQLHLAAQAQLRPTAELHLAAQALLHAAALLHARALHAGALGLHALAPPLGLGAARLGLPPLGLEERGAAGLSVPRRPRGLRSLAGIGIRTSVHGPQSAQALRKAPAQEGALLGTQGAHALEQAGAGRLQMGPTRTLLAGVGARRRSLVLAPGKGARAALLGGHGDGEQAAEEAAEGQQGEGSHWMKGVR